MTGTSTFIPLLCLIGFFAASWTCSKVSRVIGFPLLLLEIGCGILFGPQVVQLMHPEYAVCQSREFSQECALPPDFNKRLAEGLTLGPGLGRIANTGACGTDLSVFGWNARRPRLSGLNTTTSLNGSGNDSFNTVNGSNMSNVSNGTNSSVYWSYANQTENVTSMPAVPAVELFRQCLIQECLADFERRCNYSPDLFTMMGHAGIGLLVFENGLQFDFFRLKAMKITEWVSALSGAVIPMVSGFVLVGIYGEALVPDSLLAGAAMVPSTVNGIPRLMRWAGAEEFPNAGQTATTAALIDNLIALILFDIFFGIHDEFNAFRCVGSPIIGAALTALCMVAAVLVWPRLLQEMLLPRLPKVSWDPRGRLPDDVLFFIMVGLLVLYAWIFHLLNNYLWGCFAAGMSFACLKPLDAYRQLWVQQTKVMMIWMVRIFYSCTVAFAIPVGVLFTGEAFWKGIILGFFPCIVGKLLSAAVLSHNRRLVALLLTGRGEVAFFIASMSVTQGMMEPKTYCIVMWALLWANLLGPLAFPFALRQHRLMHSAGAEPKGENGDHRLESLDGIDLEEPYGVPPEQVDRTVAEEEADDTHRQKRYACCLFVPGAAQ